jgi:hypothetical protein
MDFGAEEKELLLVGGVFFTIVGNLTGMTSRLTVTVGRCNGFDRFNIFIDELTVGFLCIC